MTSTTTPASTFIEVTLPEPFSPGWERLDGVTVDGNTFGLDAERYFFRQAAAPTWLLCDWEAVRRDLLPVTETTDVALEQHALGYVRSHGRSTTDPAEVLRVAWHVYAWLFRPEHLQDPGLAGVTADELRMLHEMGTVMALNRVELTGEITQIGPAWFFPATAQVVYGLDDAATARLDELYHGGFFNEYRRAESILAHAALGGRLVHGCQSVPDQSGGCVVAYGTDLTRFRTELDGFKHAWMDAIRAKL